MDTLPDLLSLQNVQAFFFSTFSRAGALGMVFYLRFLVCGPRGRGPVKPSQNGGSSSMRPPPKEPAAGALPHGSSSAGPERLPPPPDRSDA
ncbi:Uncharacterised protein [Mycobacteroides abscessus subsp. abscessus]|nr:Uncharacterised protein [Mycobacteroides abscessus subsp. abscessus]